MHFDVSTLKFRILHLKISSSPCPPVLTVTSWETLEQIWPSSLALSSAPPSRYLLLITQRGQTFLHAGRVPTPYPPKPRSLSTWSAPPTSSTSRAESNSRFPPSWPHWRARTRAAKVKAPSAQTAQVEFLTTTIHNVWAEWNCSNNYCRYKTIKSFLIEEWDKMQDCPHPIWVCLCIHMPVF